MKNYLWHSNTCEWKLHNSDDKNFQQQLDDRKIVIGDSAEIGNFAEIGNYAEIGKLDIFTKEYIYLQFGLLPDKEGNYLLYKSVNPDLTAFYNNGDKKYQYKIEEGDSAKLERNQAIECGEGWHFTNLTYAIAFAEKRPHKIISAVVNIEDILSVYTKVRVRKFSNVQEVKLNWNYEVA